MNFWIRCENCGKVEKYPYPANTVGDPNANSVVWKQAEEDGWIIYESKTFCSEECKKDCIEHYERTNVWLNLPAAYKYQQSLKGEE